MFAFAVGALIVEFGALLLASGGGSDDGSKELAVQGTSTDVDADALDADELVDPNSAYDPVRAGEETPSSYRQLLRRDQIAPIYDPSFTTVDDIDWPLDALIVGVTGTETSKAYPACVHLVSGGLRNILPWPTVLGRIIRSESPAKRSTRDPLRRESQHQQSA